MSTRPRPQHRQLTGLRVPAGSSLFGRRGIWSPQLLALRVGALFLREGSAAHYCTASVVGSPGHDLLITAAHCIYSAGYRQDVVFIPDYRDGQAPLGIWTVRQLLVAPEWISDSDPDFDVGFVVLNQHDGHNIQDILGANQLGVDAAYQYLVALPDTRQARARRLPVLTGLPGRAPRSFSSTAADSPACAAGRVTVSSSPIAPARPKTPSSPTWPSAPAAAS